MEMGRDALDLAKMSVSGGMMRVRAASLMSDERLEFPPMLP